MSDEPTLTTTGGDTPVFARYVHACCEHSDAWRALAVELGEALRRVRAWGGTRLGADDTDELNKLIDPALRRLQERQEA